MQALYSNHAAPGRWQYDGLSSQENLSLPTAQSTTVEESTVTFQIAESMICRMRRARLERTSHQTVLR